MKYTYHVRKRIGNSKSDQFESFFFLRSNEAGFKRKLLTEAKTFEIKK